MAQQGWYPDPGGQEGMFRYWDGGAWSPVISPTPLPGPPPDDLGTGWQNPITVHSTAAQPGGGSRPLASDWKAAAQNSAYNQYQTMTRTKAKKPVGLWISLTVGVLVLALVAYFIVTRVGGGVGPDQTDPVNNPTTPICPTQTEIPPRGSHPNDGRVYGGRLSYPMLPIPPWSEVATTEVRVPFGRDIAEQAILVHENTNPFSRGNWGAWVISVLVGELYAGDGFYAPQQASVIVNRCIFGQFYSDTKITAETLRSEAYIVDGYDGWITETNLTFSIPDLPTTSELAIVIIVQTSSEASSIFYASIPNDATQYMPDVNAAIAGLRVT